VGGLARRASIIKKLRNSTPGGRKFLLLGGNNEIFDKRDPGSIPKARTAPGFIKAYELMGYDRVYLTEDESRWLVQSGQPLPALFKAAGPGAFAEKIMVGGIPVGVVLFPEIEPGLAKPGKAAVNQVLDAADSLEGEVKLLVGVSHWGKRAESEFLKTSGHPFDILLGGGVGPGLEERLMNDGKTFWVRSFFKGRALNVIRIMKLPGDSGAKWVLGQNVNADVSVLSDDIADDPEVGGLFK